MLIAWCFAAALFLAFQLVLVRGFVRATNDCWTGGQPGPRKRAIVVLCARGADLTLLSCLNSLADQLGAEDRLVLVTDSELDPAVAVWQRFVASRNAFQNLTRLTATPEDDRCSLKCHSLARAMTAFHDPSATWVLVDSDAVPPEDFLDRLLASLNASGAQAVFGNRWYEPHVGSAGSWVRHLWNAAAIVQMHHYRIAWGGALAIGNEAVVNARLIEIWQRSLFEDVLIDAHLNAHGMKLRPAAGVFVRQQTACSIGEAFDWMCRQLLDVRLYHRRWPWVWLHAAASSGLLLWAIGIGLAAVVEGDMMGLAIITGSVLGLQLSQAGLVNWIRSAVDRSETSPTRRSLSSRGWRWFLFALGMMPIVQVMHFAATLIVSFQRRARWRGIDYRIDGPFEIRRCGYHVSLQTSEIVP